MKRHSRIFEMIKAGTFIVMLVMISSCNANIEEEIQNTDENEHSIHAQPNILLIIADDVGLDATPNYVPEFNFDKAVMPTLEKLMNEGLVFENLWAYSVCSPTRASIITGKQSIQTDVYKPGDFINPSEKSLHTYIDEQTNNAYAHGVFGKWHLSSAKEYSFPTDMGIGTFSGLLGGGLGDYWNFPIVIDSEQTDVTDYYATSKFTDLAIDWKNEQTKPWFLWVAYNAAHTPFHRPDDTLISDTSLPAYENKKTDLPYYLAMLEAMDHEMGRLIDSMSEEEKANTVILYIGDNGSPKKVAQFSDRIRHSKGSIYQGGINVPFVVSGNGVRVGREDALVNSSDLFSTIAQIAGSNVTAINESFSFKELLYDENAASKEYVYSSMDQNLYTVRNHTYKLISVVDGTEAEEEMYNLKLDAYEDTNILLRTLTDEETQARLALRLEGQRVRGE